MPSTISHWTLSMGWALSLALVTWSLPGRTHILMRKMERWSKYSDKEGPGGIGTSNPDWEEAWGLGGTVHTRPKGSRRGKGGVFHRGLTIKYNIQMTNKNNSIVEHIGFCSKAALGDSLGSAHLYGGKGFKIITPIRMQ